MRLQLFFGGGGYKYKNINSVMSAPNKPYPPHPLPQKPPLIITWLRCYSYLTIYLQALSPKLLTAVPWPSFYLHRYRLNVKSDRFWRIFFFIRCTFLIYCLLIYQYVFMPNGAIKTRIHLRWAIFFLFSTQFLPNMVMQQKMHTEFSAIRLIHFWWCSKMVIIEIYFILFFIT